MDLTHGFASIHVSYSMGLSPPPQAGDGSASLRDNGKRADATRVGRDAGVGAAVGVDKAGVGRRVDGAQPPGGTYVGEVGAQAENRELALVRSDFIPLASTTPSSATVHIDLAKKLCPGIDPRPAGGVAGAVRGGVQLAERKHVRAAKGGDKLLLRPAGALDVGPDGAVDIAPAGVVGGIPLAVIEADPRHDADVMGCQRGIADIETDVEANDDPIHTVDRPVIADVQAVECARSNRGILFGCKGVAEIFAEIYGVVESGVIAYLYNPL